jgi:hypothetical protein
MMIFIFIIALILIYILIPAYTEIFWYVFTITGLGLGFLKWHPKLNPWFEHMVL